MVAVAEPGAQPLTLKRAVAIGDVAAQEDLGARLRPVVFGNITVRFGGWSHSSGQLRAYATCCNSEHRACRRYAVVHLFDGIEHAVAYLVGWAEMGGDLTREEHQRRSCEAPAARRERIRAALVT